MEEVSTEKFNWFLSFGSGVVAFILGWITRLQMKFNTTDKGLAVNTQSDTERDKQLHKLESSIIRIERDIKTLKNCFQDMKEINNNTLIRVNAFMDELE